MSPCEELLVKGYIRQQERKYLHHFHATLRELLGCFTRAVPSHCSDLKLLGELGMREDCLDHGTALSASRAKYGEDLGHFVCRIDE
jgi:hypothetical protein